MTAPPAPGPHVLPGMPTHHDEPVFGEPWQAQAFAMVVSLHQAGLFTWTEWADELARQIGAAQRADEADLGDTYYQHWLAALETLVAGKGLASSGDLARCRCAWAEAAERTPHGQPIELRPQDFEH